MISASSCSNYAVSEVGSMSAMGNRATVNTQAACDWSKAAYLRKALPPPGPSSQDEVQLADSPSDEKSHRRSRPMRDEKTKRRIRKENATQSVKTSADAKQTLK